MAVPRTTLWPIQPHTAAKHAILRRYLQAWLPIMSRYNGRIVFIDGFAGPGQYSGGEDGSPLIALRTLLEHPHFRRESRGVEVVFLFIESDSARAAALREALANLGAASPLPTWISYEVIEGEFAPSVSHMLNGVEATQASVAPIFAFIDPFGFAGVPMGVIARLLRNPRCECLINFSFESINRFVEHPDPKIRKHADELFGTSEWRGLVTLGDSQARRDEIVDLYRKQLIEEAGIAYVRTFEMLNEGNRTEYVLFYGTKSPEGLSKMKQAMWKVDPEGGQVFSDRSDPRQMVLLQAGGESGLSRMLQERFRREGFVAIETVERFVLEETPYSEKMHLKRKTLGKMERASPSQLEVRRPRGARERAGDYPSGTMLKLL